MFRKLRDFWSDWGGLLGFAVLIVGLFGGGIWYMTRPTTYDFSNSARLVVPCGAISIDKRNEGYGIVIESGVNVTVHNDWMSGVRSRCLTGNPITESSIPTRSRICRRSHLRPSGQITPAMRACTSACRITRRKSATWPPSNSHILHLAPA